MFVRCIRDFCECSIAGRREESLGEEHFTKHPTVRLNDARSADSRCGLANATLLASTRRCGTANGTFPAFVGTLRLRTRWWPRGARNMVDEKRIARVVGLALGSVFLAGLFLNALT